MWGGEGQANLELDKGLGRGIAFSGCVNASFKMSTFFRLWLMGQHSIHIGGRSGWNFEVITDLFATVFEGQGASAFELAKVKALFNSSPEPH